jgi:hypothetical protein
MMPEEAHVASECQAVQETLSEHGGAVERLDGVAREHLEACPHCREVAAAEHALGLIFSRAVPPADLEIERAVMLSLAPVRLRRRVVAFVPVAASLLFALVGALLVGGVPGSGALNLLPGWSAQGWVALAGSVSEWYAVVTTGARAAAATIDPRLFAGAAVLGLLGLAGVVATAVRWRKASPWRARS